jgi:hypothetical protein
MSSTLLITNPNIKTFNLLCQWTQTFKKVELSILLSRLSVYHIYPIHKSNFLQLWLIISFSHDSSHRKVDSLEHNENTKRPFLLYLDL